MRDDPDQAELFAPPVTIARESLLEEMPEHQFEAIAEMTLGLLNRRLDKVQKMTDVASSDVNINPFLMLALAPAYNIFSPFEAAEYAQMAKLPHGDATAFGRFVEDKIFPIFDVRLPAEKTAKHTSTVWSSIDREITVDGRRILMTLKAGPWTMNQSHAHEMAQNFPAVHEATGCDIVIGIYYGKRTSVNNKPLMVRGRTGPYVHTLVGKDLWEFVTGVRDAHIAVFRAIKEAQARFAVEHGGKTFYEHLIEARLKLAQSFRDAFDLVGEETEMWEGIFKGSF
ncbi:PmeII family type II restriction endonuclease [Nocardioides acrostichi]|uniref:Type II restriction endonuclease EcoO109IR domain-containing protein n=1 Tax=Nocardioides acrostichi TaxID=2784339 RepID=A0A930V5D8_9ACTN|nr:PmeII family type II restriction endonuclease [Nocardioides acrostichi]MBF4163489.1 hypothetical protein [Nocardioides acrostichi]